MGLSRCGRAPSRGGSLAEHASLSARWWLASCATPSLPPCHADAAAGVWRRSRGLGRSGGVRGAGGERGGRCVRETHNYSFLCRLSKNDERLSKRNGLENRRRSPPDSPLCLSTVHLASQARAQTILIRPRMRVPAAGLRVRRRYAAEKALLACSRSSGAKPLPGPDRRLKAISAHVGEPQLQCLHAYIGFGPGVPILSNLFQNLQVRSACENFEEICCRA